LLGEVAGTTCVAGKLSQLEIDTEDVAAILLRFENGALGEIHLDYIQRAYRRTCQIIGEEGTLHWDYTAGEVRWFSAETKKWKVYSNPVGWSPNQMYLTSSGLIAEHARSSARKGHFTRITPLARFDGSRRKPKSGRFIAIPSGGAPIRCTWTK